jgi:hypothetical protein
MKKFLALSVLFGTVATNAHADFTYNPVALNGHRIDHCSGPAPGANDCSPAGEMRAATTFCTARDQRPSSAAIAYTKQTASGNAYHWDGARWQDLPTGEVFASVTCR